MENPALYQPQTSLEDTELVDLLQAPATHKIWDRICEAINAWPNDDTLQAALEYTEQHLAAWRVSFWRNVHYTWLFSSDRAHFAYGENPRLRLANAWWWQSPPHGANLPAVTRVRGFDHIEHFTISCDLNAGVMAHMLSEDFLPGVRSMEFRSRARGKAFAKLASAPFFQRLDVLTLGCGAFGLRAPAVEALRDAGALGGLRSLMLTGADEEILSLVIDDEGLGGLESLYLTHKSLSTEMVHRLAACPNLSGLKILRPGYLAEGHLEILQGSPYLSEAARTSLQRAFG